VKELVRRYYEELWNRWDDAAVDEIVAPDIEFRGSIGRTTRGIAEFRGYVAQIRAAFPDFHNEIEELIAEGDKVVARLTYTGTHAGSLFGIAATGRRIRYEGLALFTIRGGKIARGFVLGDTDALRRQLAAPTLPPGSGIAAATDAEREWAAVLMATSDPWRKLGRTLEQCQAALRNPSLQIHVAHGAAGEPLGYIMITPEGLAGSPYIRTIIVAHELRSSGVGTRLMEFAEELYRGRARWIFLCVTSFNERARALYERLGYVCVGELPDYLVDGATEILMKKRLS
jgi:steroid delta-isomerase-like uncharacterized protein